MGLFYLHLRYGIIQRTLEGIEDKNGADKKHSETAPNKGGHSWAGLAVPNNQSADESNGKGDRDAFYAGWELQLTIKRSMMPIRYDEFFDMKGYKKACNKLKKAVKQFEKEMQACIKLIKKQPLKK